MEADRTEIEMIFNNLISNAVKYNRDQGRVGVTVGMTGDEVRIQVEDTGIGMTQEETQRLFSDFSRIKNEKTRHILGKRPGTVHAEKTGHALQRRNHGQKQAGCRQHVYRDASQYSQGCVMNRSVAWLPEKVWSVRRFRRDKNIASGIAPRSERVAHHEVSYVRIAANGSKQGRRRFYR